MRNHALSRGRLFVVCVLGALAGVVPNASAQDGPGWTCRASAAYAEVNLLLGPQRSEPVLANGNPNRDNPDLPQCATDSTGVQPLEIPSGLSPLITAEAASASTQIAPEFAAAREQTVSANAGIAETVRVTLGTFVIDVEAITASARGTCVNGQPELTSSSKILAISIAGQPPIEIPDAGQGPVDLNLGLLRLRLNQEQLVNGPGGDQQLIRQAVHLELLPLGGSEPLTRVVLGEVKVDFHGAVCAPAVPQVCPEGFTPQTGSNPLLCVKTVTAPCPSGSTADPSQGGACIVIRDVAAPCPSGTTADPTRGNACIMLVQSPPANCPAGSTRDPATNNCVLIRDRPCPEGATPDPATRVCVATRVNNVGSGENGRIGSATGPVATCGRLTMRFVRGTRSLGTSFTSRFGNRAVTRGQLVTCGSNPRPIIGARVDVVHVLPGNKRRRKTGLRSRAGGKLTLILPIDLKTRSIEYAYRPDLRSTRVTSRVTLRLTVKNRAGRTLR